MDAILPRFGQCRTDYEIFSGIARQLDFEDEFTEGRNEDQWIQELFERTRKRARSEGAEFPTYGQFVANGKLKVEAPLKPGILFEQFREDPAGGALKTPSGKIEIFSEVIDSYDYADCPGHPTWMAPSEWLGKEDIDDNILHLISNQPEPRLHSQLDHGAYSRAHKLNNREPIRINPNDAKRRHIEDGDTVQVKNARGRFLATAKLDDNLSERVVQIATGAWLDPEDAQSDEILCKHGNPNMVTHDRGTSNLAQGPAAMSCLVTVEKYIGQPPPVTAFNPPEIT